MVSSASSGVYDDYGHVDISCDDEPFSEIVLSDDEDLDDFQPFSLPDPVHDGEPVVDDVLAVGPQLNYDDTSSTDIRRARLHADATDSSFDTLPIATKSPGHTHAPISTPVDTPTVAPLDSQTPHTTPVTPIPGYPFTPTIVDPHHVDLPTIFSLEIPAPRPWEGTSRNPAYFETRAPVDFMSAPYLSPPESSPHHQSPRLFPPYSMPLFDLYHPSHHSGYTRDDLLLPLQLQV
ncbi:hypothetical protein Hanom_Chr16g01460481 [Helianthus anomalus]